jgi:exosome complex component RRP43
MSNEGYVVPNFELSPVSSPNVHPGPPSEQEQVISQFLSDLVNKSSFINLESLCIEVGKLAWVLYCDLVCLDSDGSLTDASVVALLAALASMRLPGSRVNEDTGLGEVTDTEEVRLHLNGFPVATTFGLFDG